MRHTMKGIIATLAVVLASAALAASAGASRGPGLATRTATELGQRVPGYAALATRTPTELGQRVPGYAAPTAEVRAFDWGDAAIGAGVVVALGFGGFVLVRTRRHPSGSAESPLTSA